MGAILDLSTNRKKMNNYFKILIIILFSFSSLTAKNIYTLEEFKLLPLKEKNFDELNYAQKELNLFFKSFNDIKAMEETSLVLDKPRDNILDVFNDKNFLKNYPEDNVFIVYYKNKMMPIIWTKYDGCMGGAKYLMVLEKNQLKIKTINMVSYHTEPVKAKDFDDYKQYKNKLDLSVF